MALNPVLSDMISHACQVADKILELKGLLDEMNILYDAQGGFKSSMTADEIAEMGTLFAGLTKAQLDDGMYVLTATLRGDVANGFSQLVQLAARA